jgi:hypothetical protein
LSRGDFASSQIFLHFLSITLTQSHVSPLVQASRNLAKKVIFASFTGRAHSACLLKDSRTLFTTWSEFTH